MCGELGYLSSNFPGVEGRDVCWVDMLESCFLNRSPCWNFEQVVPWVHSTQFFL